MCVCLIHFTQFTGKIRDKLFDFAKYYGNVIGDTDQQQIKFGLSKSRSTLNFSVNEKRPSNPPRSLFINMEVMVQKSCLEQACTYDCCRDHWPSFEISHRPQSLTWLHTKQTHCRFQTVVLCLPLLIGYDHQLRSPIC